MPRWHWKSKLRHRGGILEGKSQKSEVRIDIDYQRRVWEAQLYEKIKKQWIMTDEVSATNLADVIDSIKALCEVRK